MIFHDVFTLKHVAYEIYGNETHTFPFSNEVGNFTRLQFILHIKQNGNTFKEGIIWTGFLISLFSPYYYLLPVGHGERVTFLAITLLTLVTLLVTISTLVP